MSLVYHLLDESEEFSERTGGAISRWAANVLRDGNEVVICPDYDSTWGFPVDRLFRLPYWGITDPIHPLLYRSPWSLQKRFYLRLFQPLLRKLQPGDILYTHNRPESAAVLATLMGQYGFRVVLHMHNSHLVRANKGQLAALRNVPIVFCSKFLRDEIMSACPGHFQNTHVVYNGADSAKFHAANRIVAAIPTIIFTGRLVPYKGVHILMDAMKRLAIKGVSAQCKIVGGAGFGQGKSTRYVRRLERTCPDNTHLLGYKTGDALADLLRSSDIFCCPSIWNDPFPLAPLEAMATGLPVVASRSGGLPEMLQHGGGLLVTPGNGSELAIALETLVLSNQYREELGAKAVESFRANFLWSSVRTQYNDVIRSL